MNRIRELRLLRGITVEELSRATCVPLGIIVRLDKGEDVTASEPIWNGLSNFFGVPVDSLMGFYKRLGGRTPARDFHCPPRCGKVVQRRRTARLFAR